MFYRASALDIRYGWVLKGWDMFWNEGFELCDPFRYFFFAGSLKHVDPGGHFHSDIEPQWIRGNNVHRKGTLKLNCTSYIRRKLVSVVTEGTSLGKETKKSLSPQF